MATNRPSAMAGALSRALREMSPGGGTDGELLTAFIDRRDAAAFAELVRRHGPMVLGVCLRTLRHEQDAEDAFQATFLVLAKKADSVTPRNAVGNWLYGVAYQTAVRARAVTLKRRQRELTAPSQPEPATASAGWDDLAAVLDEELSRLPDHYRAVVVLCDVEGRTRADTAAHLGCPEGSVSSRLSRARAMLARRLTRRGVSLATGALANLVAQNAAARPPVSLTKGAVEAALAGGLSHSVATLADGVLKSMRITKLKAVTLAVVLVGAVGVGSFAGYQAAQGQDAARPGGGLERASPAPKHAQADDAKLIQGTWVVVGSRLTAPESIFRGQSALINQGVYRIFITADKMIHSPDQSEEAYRLDTARKPKVLEMLKDGKVVAKAIYELKGDDLKICQVRALPGGEVPEPPNGFDFKFKAGTFAMLFDLKREHASKAEALYDFRASPRYRALPAADRQALEQVNHDFALLWGALDLYSEEHLRAVPETLDALVPRYLKEVPKDPFATKATAEEKKLGPYVASRGGWGYRYRPGRGNYSFVLASVGLPDFPYLAASGNVGLYRARGLWLSGRQPVPTK